MICEPEIGSIQEIIKGDFIIIACDGLWDVVSNEEAVKVVNENMASRHSRKLVATVLRDIAYSRNNNDNISILVVFCCPSTSKIKSSSKWSKK
jgi:serine/threonine protein phosphatase PrpC